MQLQVHQYFSFSKSERRGIVVLILLIVSTIVVNYGIPYYYKPKASVLTAEQVLLLAALNATPDTVKNALANRKSKWVDYDDNYDNNYTSNNNYKASPLGTSNTYTKNNKKPYAPNPNYAENMEGALYAFNPNTINATEWATLGLSPKAVSNIINYLSKGGQIRQPDDIAKIYGISPEMAARLMPYITIPATNYITTKAPTTYTPSAIDISTADTTAWKKLPGIGATLAMRILMYKTRLGGFINTSQIAEVYGMPDSTYQKIKPYLLHRQGNLTTININTSSITMLQHPYITKAVANNIIQYRNQHGNYTNLEQLKNLALITNEVYNKIAPYLSVN